MECTPCQKHGSINARNATPLTTNLQIELFDVWGIDYNGPFPKSWQFEYILVAVDYVSKWVETLPCRAADSNNAKRMFTKIIFPHFGVPRMVISDGGPHSLIGSFDASYPIRESIITSRHHIILKLADKQKHQTSKSRTFYRRLSMRWGQHGKISYPEHYGLTEQLPKHLLECHHINSSMRRHATYLLSWNSKHIGP
jgi:hypothetical protein